MGNILTVCTRPFKAILDAWKSPTGSPQTGPACESDQDLLQLQLNSRVQKALAAESHEQGATSSSPFFPAQDESMRKMRTESGRCNIEEQIERSKSHWSELEEPSSDDDEVAEISNVKVFRLLQLHPKIGHFFATLNGENELQIGELVVGEKFAEGGQAELYEAELKSPNLAWQKFVLDSPREHVVKVFKKGTKLRQLLRTWPEGLWQILAGAADAPEHEGIKYFFTKTCDIVHATLLADGRFAFLMRKEDEDLRSFIDRQMTLKTSQDHGPFSRDDAIYMMIKLSHGMVWLHDYNIVHRDLKASNVLVYIHGLSNIMNFFISDFECSGGVVGTGFFRAPEILQACKDGNVSQRLDLFTKAADVYSYGMTCYEILTGKLPFEDHRFTDYDLVLNGQCPKLPEYVDEWICKLLSRCWQPNPADRPSFREIRDLLIVSVDNSDYMSRDWRSFKKPKLNCVEK